MKRQALAALLLVMTAGLLSAGFSVGRPAAVKKQVSKLDDKVHARLLAGAVSNRAPANVAVVAVSTTVAAGGLAIISVSALDPDGDALQYNWTAASGTLSAASGASVYWLAPSTPGVYSVNCAVSDGKTAAPGSVGVAAVSPGTLRWTFTPSVAASFSSLSSPAVDKNGNVYATADDGSLHAIYPDGSPKWVFTPTADTINTNFGPVVGADGTIYVVADSGVTYALNPDKSLKWDPPFDPLGLVSFPPVPTAGGSVYVFDDNNDINSLHLVGPTGIGVSTFTDLPNTLAQPPVVGADGTLYLVDGGSNLYVMSPAEVTTSTQADQISAPPAVATDGTIYWVESSTDVYILNPDLSQKFEPFTPPGGANISEAPVIASDGSVYVFDDANSLLYKINPATGVGAPFTALTGVVYKPAAGPDGAIYLDDNGTGNDELYGLNPNGTDKWAPFLPPGLLTINSVPGVGADGTVAFTGDDGNVYAVHSTSVLP